MRSSREQLLYLVLIIAFAVMVALSDGGNAIYYSSETVSMAEGWTDESGQAVSLDELPTGAQAHHERPDGKGYPNRLKGEEIPRVAQVIAVADCFDAMYSNRPYRSRMSFEKAVAIIREVSGTQLTEDVVDAFLRLVDRGEFRDPEDDGSGSTRSIDNIRK